LEVKDATVTERNQLIDTKLCQNLNETSRSLQLAVVVVVVVGARLAPVDLNSG